MLDLTQYAKRTFTIKLPDGQTVKIKRPTMRFIAQFEALANADRKNILTAVDDIGEVVLDILNNNEQDIKFNRGYIDLYLTMEMCMAIVEKYLDFANELTSEKN